MPAAKELKPLFQLMNTSKRYKIKFIKAKEILDSRKKPTVEVKISTNFGVFLASVPSGASRGESEAIELRDIDGRGVKCAVKNIEKIIAPKLKDEIIDSQEIIDEILTNLDGTKNKSKLGANAILPVSIAVCRAGAESQKLPLYKYISQIYGIDSVKISSPCFNIINGGKHAKSGLSIQEFMVVPEADSYHEKLEMGKKVYKVLGLILEKKYGKKNIATGDEGGFVPPIKKIKEALDFLMEAIKEAGFEGRVKIILDAASSFFYSAGKYSPEGIILGKNELLDFYIDLVRKYPIIAIEDPFSQEDWEGWAMLNCKLQIANCKLLIIGDDLTSTNPERIKLAKEKEACDAIIVKPNQIGTVTETIEAAKLAKSYGWKLVVSHRSGETIDDFIADLAVGLGADFIKSGAPVPKERMVKYKRLLKIEKELK